MSNCLELHWDPGPCWARLKAVSNPSTSGRERLIWQIIWKPGYTASTLLGYQLHTIQKPTVSVVLHEWSVELAFSCSMPHLTIAKLFGKLNTAAGWLWPRHGHIWTWRFLEKWFFSNTTFQTQILYLCHLCCVFRLGHGWNPPLTMEYKVTLLYM